MRELKAIREEAFSQAFNLLYECMRKRAETVLSDGINNFFYLFCVVFYVLSSGI
jgi:hypothetical protein